MLVGYKKDAGQFDTVSITKCIVPPPISESIDVNSASILFINNHDSVCK